MQSPPFPRYLVPPRSLCFIATIKSGEEYKSDICYDHFSSTSLYVPRLRTTHSAQHFILNLVRKRAKEQITI